MDLNAIEKEMIAGLTSNPAFILLLQTMETSIQILQEDLEHTLDKEKAEALLQKWRAVKWAHRELKTTPERFNEELAEYFEQKKQFAGGLNFPNALIGPIHQSVFPFAR
jgi:transaldolase